MTENANYELPPLPSGQRWRFRRSGIGGVDLHLQEWRQYWLLPGRWKTLRKVFINPLLNRQLALDMAAHKLLNHENDTMRDHKRRENFRKREKELEQDLL